MKPHMLVGLILAAGFAHVSLAYDATDAALVDCTVPNAIGGTCPDAGAWHGASEPHDAHAAQVRVAGAPEKHATQRKQIAHAAGSIADTGHHGAGHAP